MTPERWSEIQQQLSVALSLSSGERGSFLESLAARDAELKCEVESLLVGETTDPEFLSTPAFGLLLNLSSESVPTSPSMVGRTFGAYRVTELLGTGGMGEVYRGVRVDGQYDQEVAVKIVRPGLRGEFRSERFRNERQILARLDHANIAKILDGGITDEGLSYFVMELVRGIPITEYCDRHRLSIEERLRLFRTVCSAVHYAHQRLIVHRDLKPTNIFVNREGIPKLLDFGIAKTLNPDSTVADATSTGVWAMTPDYASPEQFSGEPITTATDVYSLGLILYELLTGKRAHRFSSRMPYAMARTVLESEPEKPSSAIASERKPPAMPDPGAETPLRPSDSTAASELRGFSSAKKLRRRLVGDPDNIVLKALRKEPAGRYASADQLSEDIRRHLEGRPVIASKRTTAYRVHKYVLRHKAGVASAALIFVILVTGIIVTLREARIARQNELRADRRFHDVRALAHSLLFDVHDSIKNLAGATPARKLLVSKALQYLQRLSEDAAGDAALQNELAEAYEHVGDVQGHPFYPNLGDTAGALASYHSALALRESIAAHRPTQEARQNLAADYERIGVILQTQKDCKPALQYLGKEFVIAEELEQSSEDVPSKDHLAGVHFLMALCYSAQQDPRSALEHYQASAAIRETIAGESGQVRSNLAGTYAYMAPILWSLGDHRRALALQRNALEIMRKLSDSDPANAYYREFVDEGYYWLGHYLERSGDVPHAMANYQRASADFEGLASVDPEEIRVRRYVALCHKSIGTSLVELGRYAQGLTSVRKAVSEVERLPRQTYPETIAETYSALGFAYSRSGSQPGIANSARIADWHHARDAYQKSLDLWLQVKNAAGLDFTDTGEPERIRSELARCETMLGRLKSKAF